MKEFRSLKFEKVLVFIVLFSFLNGFYFLGSVNSTIVWPIYIVILYFTVSKINTREIILLLNSKYVRKLSLLIVFGILLSSFFIISHLSSDFTVIKLLILQLYYLLFFVLFVPIVKHVYVTSSEGLNFIAIKLLVLVFLLQSIIQALAYLNLDIASFVHLFYKQEMIEKMYDGYGGIRGVSLSGSPGWGLAVGYALAFLFYVKNYWIDRRIRLFGVFCGLLLILGSLFAGRSALVGVLLGVIFFLFSNVSLIYKLKSIFILFFLVLFSYLLSELFFPGFLAELFFNRFFRAFEFIHNYLDYGVLETSSTNKLIEMWQVPISDAEILFGSGMYFSDGEFYMGTDVGYLRNLLFGGIFWVLFLVYYHFYLCSVMHRLDASPSSLMMAVFVFILGLVLELKALTISYNKYFMLMLMFYICAKVLSYENKARK